MWVYLLSTMAGGACAGLTYDKLFLEEIQVSRRHTHNTHTHMCASLREACYLPPNMLSVSISKQLLLHEVSHAPLRVAWCVASSSTGCVPVSACRTSNVMGLVIFCRIYVSQPADSEDRDDEV